MTDHYKQMLLNKIETMQLELERLYDLIELAPSGRELAPTGERIVSETPVVPNHETNGFQEPEKSLSLSETDFKPPSNKPSPSAKGLNSVVKKFFSELEEGETFDSDDFIEKMGTDRDVVSHYLRSYLDPYLKRGDIVRKIPGIAGVRKTVYQKTEKSRDVFR